MFKMSLKIIIFTIFIISNFLIGIGDVRALDLDINNNTISIHADSVPLQAILGRVADTGIAIYVDPGINPKVSASFENRDLEAGLKSILKSVNYVFIWKALENITETSPPNEFKLVEIRIFREGKKALMLPLEKQAKNDTSFQEFEAKVIIKRNKVFVPVILGYQGREVRTTLVFDTGANSIVLHDNIADGLGITKYSISKARGVGGIEINTKVTQLDYVRVGPHQKTGLLTHIIEYKDPAVEYYNGVLGMNFLKGLEYSIDFDREIIIWH